MNLSCLVLLLNVAGIYGLGAFRFDYGDRYLTKTMANSTSLLNQKEKKWIEQRLDHFDPKENRTWRMKYYEFTDYWKPNGPIYLYIGGEGPVNMYASNSGYTYLQELLTETNGALFLSEHRYYGESMPLDTHETENLKYLSSLQALADLAELLKMIRSSATGSKVVVIGGSYAGNLATWMRKLYPHLVDVAIASSAPLLAKKEFFENLEKVSDDYKQLGSAGCHDKISQIFNRYEMLFSSTEGIQQLKQEDNICDYSDMTKLENKQVFFAVKIYPFQEKVQNGTPDEILKHCQEIMYNGISYLKVIFESNAKDDIFWREESGCLNVDFNGMINYLKQTADYRLSWMYQVCTEFGYFQTTNSYKHPFTNNLPVDYFYKICMALFGPQFNENRIDAGIKYTNAIYGGLSPNVTKVVFVFGDMDPWGRLGILHDISSDVPAIVIPKTSHCRDLYPGSDQDSKELVDARKKIKKIVKQWIGFGV